jgi:hypothetical protein
MVETVLAGKGEKAQFAFYHSPYRANNHILLLTLSSFPEARKKHWGVDCHAAYFLACRNKAMHTRTSRAKEIRSPIIFHMFCCMNKNDTKKLPTIPISAPSIVPR